MSRDRTPDLLVVWTLASFQTAALMAAITLALYLSGGLASFLGALSTAAGLGTYAIFWSLTFAATFKATESEMGRLALARRAGPEILFGRGFQWGMAAGMFVVGVGAVVLIGIGIYTAIADNEAIRIVQTLFGVTIFLVFGLAASALIGGIVGGVMALVDVVLLAGARAVVGDMASPGEQPAPVETASG